MSRNSLFLKLMDVLSGPQKKLGIYDNKTKAKIQIKIRFEINKIQKVNSKS